MRIIEIIGYSSVLIAAICAPDVNYSPWIVFALGISIAITFSGCGIDIEIPSLRGSHFCQHFSLSVYLSHYEIILIISRLKCIYQFKTTEFMMIYLVMVIIVSLINMKASTYFEAGIRCVIKKMIEE